MASSDQVNPFTDPAYEVENESQNMRPLSTTSNMTGLTLAEGIIETYQTGAGENGRPLSTASQMSGSTRAETIAETSQTRAGENGQFSNQTSTSPLELVYLHPLRIGRSNMSWETASWTFSPGVATARREKRNPVCSHSCCICAFILVLVTVYSVIVYILAKRR